MEKPVTECQACGSPLPPKTGRGRPRLHCSDACRNTAYVERRDDTPIEPLRPKPGSALDQWIQQGTRLDEIIDSPVTLARLMDELLVRISVHALLEDYQYQRAVNQLTVIYLMIGRMTKGTTNSPASRRDIGRRFAGMPRSPDKR